MQFLSGTYNFSLTHAHVMLINLPFTFKMITSQRLTCARIPLKLLNTPVKVNPAPPPFHTPGDVGLHWGFITIWATVRVPSMWGICTFVAFALRNVGH